MRIIPMPTTAGAAVDAAATAATTAAAEPAADGMLSRFRFFGPTTSVGPNSFIATGEDGLPECGALCPVRIPVGRLQYAVRTRADFGRPFRPAGYGRSGRFWRDRTGVFGAVRWRCAPVPVGATAVYGTSEDGLSSFGRLSEGFRYPAAANRGKLIIFIAVSVSVGMYPTVRPFNGKRL